jgi:hypothetical protein
VGFISCNPLINCKRDKEDKKITCLSSRLSRLYPCKCPNLRPTATRQQAARQARVEPVEKPPERPIFPLSGRRRNFTDDNKNDDSDVSEPE